MGEKLKLRDIDPRGRKVLMRVDFNVPLDAARQVKDDTRIRAALPSIEYVLEHGGSLVLMSHLGRPKGQADPAYSLRPVADRLAELVSAPVRFAGDTIGPDAEGRAARLAAGEILLLENLRFDPGETANDAAFAAALARLGDIYANDAFGTAHRAHASTVGVTAHFAQRAGGFLMERELANLGRLLADPPRPFVAVLGGAKVKGKVEIITSLLDRVDTLLLGGGMIFTFFKVHGLEVGDSLVDTDSMDVVQEIAARARSSRAQLVLPEDCVVSTDFSEQGQSKNVLVTDIAEGWQGLDIGIQTVERYAEILAGARAVFWNGPMGVFELPRFAAGTRAVGEAVATVTERGALSVVGGGDSVAALNQLGLAGRISHVSTGGGASLEFMAGRELPGVVALSDARAGN
jgi:phosphoglycerate kinase